MIKAYFYNLFLKSLIYLIIIFSSSCTDDTTDETETSKKLRTSRSGNLKNYDNSPLIDDKNADLIKKHEQFNNFYKDSCGFNNKNLLQTEEYTVENCFLFNLYVDINWMKYFDITCDETLSTNQNNSCRMYIRGYVFDGLSIIADHYNKIDEPIKLDVPNLRFWLTQNKDNISFDNIDKEQSFSVIPTKSHEDDNFYSHYPINNSVFQAVENFLQNFNIDQITEQITQNNAIIITVDESSDQDKKYENEPRYTAISSHEILVSFLTVVSSFYKKYHQNTHHQDIFQNFSSDNIDKITKIKNNIFNDKSDEFTGLFRQYNKFHKDLCRNVLHNYYIDFDFFRSFSLEYCQSDLLLSVDQYNEIFYKKKMNEQNTSQLTN